METITVDICVIGGGASGMAAAVAARMEDGGAVIRIMEKNNKLGRKLLATGNGRCNLTNLSCAGSREILSFFRELGITAAEEEQGRVYPYNGRAGDVLRAFETYFSRHGIERDTGAAAEGITRDGRSGRLTVLTGGKEISARNVLIATGGRAGPQFGCAGDGYRLAKSVGHTVTRTIPALSPVECAGAFENLKGIRAKCAASLLRNGEVLRSESGEAQFTEYGLSGICVFNLSRYIRLDGCDFSDYEIALDLMPDRGEAELERELKARMDNINIPPDDLLISLVHEKLAELVMSRAARGPAGGSASSAARALKDLRFSVSNVKGWKFAQCTSGGVPADEINPDTMESKIVKGLYFAGEITDYDGPCGGYNLNNAWDTGIKAGRAMAKNVQDQ